MQGWLHNLGGPVQNERWSSLFRNVQGAKYKGFLFHPFVVFFICSLFNVIPHKQTNKKNHFRLLACILSVILLLCNDSFKCKYKKEHFTCMQNNQNYIICILELAHACLFVLINRAEMLQNQLSGFSLLDVYASFRHFLPSAHWWIRKGWKERDHAAAA